MEAVGIKMGLVHAGTDSVGTVLAVDIGTSSVRASIVRADGSVVAQAASDTPDDVDGELDLNRLWVALCSVIAEVVGIAGPPDAVAVAAQLGTAFLDRSLQPTAPALMWQDRRAAAQAEQLSVALGEQALSIAGRRPAPEHAAARAMWFAAAAPDEWSRTRWIVTVKDFVVAQLTGEVVTDPVSASYSLLYDVVNGAWSDTLARAASVQLERLPPVRAAGDRAGTVSRSAATATGLRAGTAVAVGGPDGSVGALGAGLVSAGATVDIAGTTDVLLHAIDHPAVDPTGRSLLNAYLLPGLWTVGGPTGMTGGAIAWLCGLLGLGTVEEAFDRLGDQVAELPPGAGGVRFYPALTGERFPHWRGDAGAEIAGLRAHHGAPHLLRAAEEGCAFALREGLEALEDMGFRVESVHISGGVSRRRQAMQLRATAWDREVVPLATSQATTGGSAMLAAACGGLHPSVSDAAVAMVRQGEPVVPDRVAAEAYQDAYRSWRAGRRIDAEVGA
jgi:xylulokinase